MSRFLRVRYGLLALALGFVVAGSGSVLRGQPDDPKDEAPNNEVLDKVDSALSLIEIGRQSLSPEALIAAAVILHENPLDESKEKVEGAEPAPSMKPADLLAEAKAMRPKDKALGAYIAELTDRFKGDSRGSIGFRGASFTLPAGRTAGTRITFKAKELAIIYFRPAMGFREESRRVTKIVNKKLVTTTIKQRVPTQVPFEVTVKDASGKTLVKRTVTPTSGMSNRYSFVPMTTQAVSVTVTNKTSTSSAHFAITSN